MLIAGAAFLAFFNIEVLDPTRVAWLLRSDFGQHALGWHAFRHDEWHWPLTSTELLSWPSGVVIGFTDSNPLVSLILKPWAFVLPESTQFVGPWFLACLILHVVIAYQLVRRFAPTDWLAVAAAAVMLAFPPLFLRFVHDTLMAHWTILWALWVFFVVDDARRRDRWNRAVLTVSVLVQPYLFFMTAAIWSADILRRYVRARRPVPDSKATRDLRYSILTTIVVVFGVAWATGLVSSGTEAASWGFGQFSMNLNALFNPMRAEFSAFLPPRPMGRTQDEGFQYLGVGYMFLFATAAASIAVYPRSRGALNRVREARWLILPAIALSLAAISHVVRFDDQVLIHVPLGSDITHKILGIVRASGRFFWVVSYLMLFISLVAVMALPRVAAAGMLATTLALQAVDIQGLAAHVRHWTTDDPVAFTYGASPAWKEISEAANVVEFQPTDIGLIAGSRLFYEVSWRAVSTRTPISTMYASRVSPAQREFERQMDRAFAGGFIDPDRLHVLIEPCAAPFGSARQVRELDSVLVIPPATMLDHAALGHPDLVCTMGPSDADAGTVIETCGAGCTLAAYATGAAAASLPPAGVNALATSGGSLVRALTSDMSYVAIVRDGTLVDERTGKGDLRLTDGGEPRIEVASVRGRHRITVDGSLFGQAWPGLNLVTVRPAAGRMVFYRFPPEGMP